MASDDPGKYREKRHRFSKPYERPKGFLQKVSDSVSGIFSGSSNWLSKWLGQAEAETEQIPNRPRNPQTWPSQETELTHFNRENLVSDNNFLNYDEMLAGPSSRPQQIMTRAPPAFSVTNLATSKAELEKRTHTTSTLHRDDASEVSESSIDTGVDVSLIPRMDRGEYQDELLQLDNDSLQNLRQSLSRPCAGASPLSQSDVYSVLDSRKRPREQDPDNSSESLVPRPSLFSESKTAFGQPQTPGLASKRPRFNVSSCDTSVLSDKSILGESSFKSSPFYPGRTTYGGASAYRKNNLIARSHNLTPRVKVKARPAKQSADDSGLSEVAKKILDSLESMSTPISDAKRIPTPISNRHKELRLDRSGDHLLHGDYRGRGSPSALPSRYMDEVQKVKNRGGVAEVVLNCNTRTTAKTVNVFTTTMENNTSKSQTILSSTPIQPSIPKPTETTASSWTPSTSSFAATKSSGSTFVDTPRPQKTLSSTTTTPNIVPSLKKISPIKMPECWTSATVSPSPPTLPSFSMPKPSPSSLLLPKAPELRAESSIPEDANKGGGGKIRNKITKTREDKNDESTEVLVPSLPSVSLPITSLPKISLPTSMFTPLTTTAKSSDSLSNSFSFSSPKVLSSTSPQSNSSSSPSFKFSLPRSVNENGLANATTAGGLMFSTPTVTQFVPKLKPTSNVEKPIPQLSRTGSVCDILNSNKNKDNNSVVNSSIFNNKNNCESCSSVLTLEDNINKNKQCEKCRTKNTNNETSSTSTKTNSGGDAYASFIMKAKEEWECSTCMIRNKNEKEKCVACETPKPSATKSTSKPVTNSISEKPVASDGFASFLLKAKDEWECNVCMLRNNKEKEKCVACEAPKPSATTKPLSTEHTKTSSKPVILDGFGSAFKKSAGEWDCDVCMVRNKSNVDACVACTTKKPGSTSSSISKTGFGNAFKKSEGEWDCDVCMVRNKSDVDACVACTTKRPGSTSSSTTSTLTSSFKLGENTGNFSFGFGANSSTSTNTTSTSNSLSTTSETSSGFKFGIASSTTTSTPSSNINFGFGFKPTTTSSTPSTAVNGEKPSSTSTTNSIFGNTTSVTSSDTAEQKTINKSTLGGFQVNSIPSFPFGTDSTNKDDKPTESKPTNSPFTFGDASKAKKIDFNFGSKIDSKATFEPPTKFTMPESTNKFTIPEVKLTSEVKPFTFGDSATKTNDLAKNGTVDFSATTPSFNFGNKVSNTSTNNGTTNSVFTFGNPTGNQTSSGFNFSSTKPDLNFGKGATTPTFGNTQSTPSFNNTSTTPNTFQFGNPLNNSTPNPAPVAFGNTGFNFNNNNNENSTFVFGQPQDKKSSVAFNFGQATTDSGSQKSALPPLQTPGVFQFGGQPAAPAPNSVFSFGNSTPAAPTPVAAAPSFGQTKNANPFNVTAPPKAIEGRVIRKAVRRARDKQ